MSAHGGPGPGVKPPAPLLAHCGTGSLARSLRAAPASAKCREKCRCPREDAVANAPVFTSNSTLGRWPQHALGLTQSQTGFPPPECSATAPLLEQLFQKTFSCKFFLCPFEIDGSLPCHFSNPGMSFSRPGRHPFEM